MNLQKLKIKEHGASGSTLLVTEDGSLIIAECSGGSRGLVAAEIAHRCNLHQELIDTLGAVVGQDHPNKWGYDAAGIAMNDEWRNKARALWIQASKSESAVSQR